MEYLFDAGPSMPSGFGEAPLSHGELRAWQDNTGIHLTPFEVRAIRRASREYVRGRTLAADPSMAPPWVPDEEASKEELASVGESLRDSIRAMAKR